MYGSRDPRDVPNYTIPMAARVVGVPLATVRSWVVGRPYDTKAGQRRSPSIIHASGRHALSFTNLIEVHVLAAMRRRHAVRLDKVRSAVRYVERTLETTHPLAREQFRTDGIDLFVDRFGALINASRGGQIEFRAALEARLERIGYESGLAVRLFPVLDGAHDRRSVVIDPRIGFGKLVLAGTGIPVAVVASRFRAGDSVAELAEDYALDAKLIEDALRADRAAA